MVAQHSTRRPRPASSPQSPESVTVVPRFEPQSEAEPVNVQPVYEPQSEVEPQPESRPERIARSLTDGELQDIADTVNLSFAKAAKHIIAAARALQKAHDRAGYGQFERLFADHPNHVQNPIQCTARYARQYLSIARHPVLNRPEHSSVLPAAVRTLYLLSKLPALVVARGIEDAQIRPHMQAHDVRLLKEEAPLPNPEDRATRRRKRERRRIADTIQRLWQKYPQHRGYLLNEVKGLEAEEPVPLDDRDINDDEETTR